MTAIAQAILGAGSVRLNFYNPVTQAWGGLGDPLGADKFEISPKSETKEKTSKKRASYGQSIASVVLGKPTEIAITLSALDREALAAQFQGTLSAWTQGAATSAAYTVSAQLDKWVAGGKRNLVQSGLTVTNDAVDMPVFRPLIGFDKEEIVTRAKAIGSYETSILPFEDCCTVFVPQHPVTRPKLEEIKKSEARFDFSQMIETAIANTEFLAIE